MKINGTEIKCFTEYDPSLEFTEGDFVVMRNDVEDAPYEYYIARVEVENGLTKFVPYATPMIEKIAGLDYLTDASSFSSGTEFISYITSNQYALVKVTREILNTSGLNYQFNDDEYICISMNQGENVILIGDSECLMNQEDSQSDFQILIDGVEMNIKLADFLTNAPKVYVTGSKVNTLYDRYSNFVRNNKYGYSRVSFVSTISTAESHEVQLDIPSVTSSPDTQCILRVFIEYGGKDGRKTYQESLDIKLTPSGTELLTNGAYCVLGYLNEGRKLTAYDVVGNEGDQFVNSDHEKIKIIEVLKLVELPQSNGNLL